MSITDAKPEALIVKNASTQLYTVVVERHENGDDNKLARDMSHEFQHLLNSEEHNRSNTHGLGTETPWILIGLHPDQSDLFGRMKNHYETNKESLRKKMPDKFTETIDELGDPVGNYYHPDELLALLRSYKVYLDQTKDSQSIQTYPYDFIDVFVPEDLRLLNTEDWDVIIDDVLSQKPNIVKKWRGEV